MCWKCPLRCFLEKNSSRHHSHQSLWDGNAFLAAANAFWCAGIRRCNWAAWSGETEDWLVESIQRACGGTKELCKSRERATKKEMIIDYYWLLLIIIYYCLLSCFSCYCLFVFLIFIIIYCLFLFIIIHYHYESQLGVVSPCERSELYEGGVGEGGC